MLCFDWYLFDAAHDDDDEDDDDDAGDDDEDDDDDDDDLNEPSCTAHKLLHPGTADSVVRNRTVLRFKKRPFGVKRCEPTCLCWMENSANYWGKAAVLE